MPPTVISDRREYIATRPNRPNQPNQFSTCSGYFSLYIRKPYYTDNCPVSLVKWLTRKHLGIWTTLSYLCLFYMQIIDSLDYGMAKVADLMIKHVLVPAISNISVTASVDVHQKSGSTSSVAVLIIAASEERQVSIPICFLVTRVDCSKLSLYKLLTCILTILPSYYRNMYVEYELNWRFHF
jgi:hypothetical protein